MESNMSSQTPFPQTPNEKNLAKKARDAIKKILPKPPRTPEEFVAQCKKNPELYKTIEAMGLLDPKQQPLIKEKLEYLALTKPTATHQLHLGLYYERVANYKKAYECILKAAYNKNPDPETRNLDLVRARAFHALARFCQEGLGVPANRETTLLNLKISAELGYYDAAIELAQCAPVHIITEKICSIWQTLANNGNAQIQTALGYLYWAGNKHLPSNYTLAYKYLSMASKKSTDTSFRIKLDRFYNNFRHTLPIDGTTIFQNAQLLAKQNYLGPLGHCYLQGIGTNKDLKQAIEYFKSALLQENGQCYDIGLASAYLAQGLEQESPTAGNGGNGQQNVKEGLDRLKKIASEKNPNAPFACLQLYSFYLDTAQNIPEAIQWIRKGVELKDAKSEYILGTYYESGTGLGKNKQQAIDLYFAAAAKKYKPAMTKVGEYYFSGIIVQQNYITAIPYLEGAADENPFAQILLGICYQQGLGVTKDSKKGAGLIAKGSKCDDPKALFFLANTYYFGEHGIEKDIRKAFLLYEAAEKNGALPAALRLAYCYLQAAGTDYNPQKGFALLQKFILQKPNHPNALYYLGTCYEFGTGVNINPQKAFECYTLAANQLAGARLQRAMCLEDGFGTPLDTEQAIAEYQSVRKELQDYSVYFAKTPSEIRSTKESFDDTKKLCLTRLANLCLMRSFETRNFKEAIVYLKEASELGSGPSQFTLAQFYELGVEVEQNSAKAEKLRQEAAKNGDIIARHYVSRQEAIKKKNAALLAEVIQFPSRFQALRSSPQYDFVSLQTAAQKQYEEIQGLAQVLKKTVEPRLLAEVEAGMKEITNLISKAQTISENFEKVYQVAYEQILELSYENIESSEEPFQKLKNDEIEYKNCHDSIREIIKKFSDVQVILEKKQSEASEKTISEKTAAEEQAEKTISDLDKKEKTELDKKEQARKEKIEKAKKQLAIIVSKKQKQQMEAFKKHQLEEQNRIEARAKQREEWIKKCKAFHEENLAKQKAQKEKRAMKEVQAQAAYWFKQDKDSYNERRKLSFSTPKERSLAAWQPELLTETIRQDNTSFQIYDCLESIKINSETQSEKQSLEDLFIERELLIKLLIHFVERLKEFRGNKTVISTETAENIQEILLKQACQYFGNIPTGAQNEQTFKIVIDKNQSLKLAVSNAIAFLKQNNIANTTKKKNKTADTAISFLSPLLTDLISTSKSPSFSKEKLGPTNVKEYKEAVEREEFHLKRLTQYQGIYSQQGTFTEAILAIIHSHINYRLTLLHRHAETHKSILLTTTTTPEERLCYLRLVSKVVPAPSEKPLLLSGTHLSETQQGLFFAAEAQRNSVNVARTIGVMSAGSASVSSMIGFASSSSSNSNTTSGTTSGTNNNPQKYMIFGKK